MDAIRTRLEAMLRMTQANGATEDEADTAMRLAAALAAKHGIDLDQLAQSTGAPKPKIVRAGKRDAMPIHQAFAARAAARLVGVRCVVFDQGKAGFEFVGRESLIEATEELMFWLFRQIEELYKVALAARSQELGRTMTSRERGEFRKTFKPACAHRVFNRAQDIAYDMRHGGTSVDTHNALTVQNYFETLEEEIHDFIYGPKPTPEQQKANWDALQNYLAKERLWRQQNPKEAAKLDRENARREARQAKRAPKPLYATGSGTDAGRAAGDQVKLRKEVE